MKPVKLTSIADQVAAHLREEILRGGLSGEMPGAKRLADSLGVNHKTVDAAVSLLEAQGLLKSQGAGKPRLITPPKSGKPPSLRIGILIYEPEDAEFHIIIELRHSLSNAGHTCVLAGKSQKELGWNLERIKKEVKKSDVDAWIVQSGSRDILEWFASQPFPCLALHGRFLGLPLAACGASMVPAVTEAVDQLLDMGHRRIVMIAQETDLVPTPGLLYRTFLEQLQSRGIQTSSYNIPIWESSPDGLHRTLDSLFKLTPPTAIFVTDVVLFFPTYIHLLKMGLRIPEDVTLISTDPHPQFKWCEPSVSHVHWDHQTLIHRIIKWADKVAKGGEDLNQIFVKAEFLSNKTIGPAPGFKTTNPSTKLPAKP